MSPELDRVEIGKLEGKFFVVPFWKNVDRPASSHFSCGKNKKLAKRLKSAWEDGVAYFDPIIQYDVNGKSYVSCMHTILMRHANADLKLRGY